MPRVNVRLLGAVVAAALITAAPSRSPRRRGGAVRPPAGLRATRRPRGDCGAERAGRPVRRAGRARATVRPRKRRPRREFPRPPAARRPRVAWVFATASSRRVATAASSRSSALAAPGRRPVVYVRCTLDGPSTPTAATTWYFEYGTSTELSRRRRKSAGSGSAGRLSQRRAGLRERVLPRRLVPAVPQPRRRLPSSSGQTAGSTRAAMRARATTASTQATRATCAATPAARAARYVRRTRGRRLTRSASAAASSPWSPEPVPAGSSRMACAARFASPSDRARRSSGSATSAPRAPTR